MNKCFYILFFFYSFLISDEITLIGDSDLFVVDSKVPVLNWSFPNAGDEFNSGENVTLLWDLNEESMESGDISLYLSTTIDPNYNLIFSNQGFLNNLEFELPDIDTEYARFKLIVYDDFGFHSETSSDYFSIGSSFGSDGGQVEELMIMGDSEPFIVDTQFPEVEIYYPNGGEVFDQGETTNVNWSVEDNSMGTNSIALYLSLSQDNFFNLVSDDIPNSGYYAVQFPMENTDYGRFKITVVDSFGYYAEDYSDDYFTIGNIDDYVISDTLLVLEGDSDSFITDTDNPEITILYPNGGEHLTDFTNVNLQWTVSDESLQNYECSASISSGLGGYFIIVNDNIPVFGIDNSYNVNMGVQGVQETLWARLEMNITDDFGNSSEDKSDGYFILGSPEGELSTELVDDEDIVILDWGWQVGHLIAIHRDATIFMNPGDEIQIIDENAIISESCESEYAESVLASVIYTGQDGHLAFKALAGVDLCSEGGSRFPGYVGGNVIKIKYIESQTGEVVDLVPDIDEVSGELVFDDEITVIYGFTNTDSRIINQNEYRRQNFNSNSAISVLSEERDFTSYNIYRTTNQVNLRDCEDDTNCTLVDGECQCIIANNVPQSYYFDNYSAQQEQWCYDVWLLDNEIDQNEILKTIDSCVGTNLEFVLGDSNADGVVNILDVVLLVAYILGNADLSEQGLVQGDVNQDGIINILDIVAAVQLILN